MLPNLTLYKKGKLTDLEGRGREKVQNLRKKKKKKNPVTICWKKGRPNFHFSQLGIKDNV